MTTNYNPYVYYWLKVENKPNAIVDEPRIDEKALNVPLATRMVFNILM